MRKKAGDREGAEALALQAAHHGKTDALFAFATEREEAGDQEGAENLYRQAADRGSGRALAHDGLGAVLKRLWPYGLDPDGTPTPRWQ
jgi:hypothetical protein